MRLMKPITTIAVALCFLLAVPSWAQCPDAGSLTFTTTLAGTQLGGQGSPAGFGNGYITFNPGTNQITTSLRVRGIGGNITGAGLYNGTTGGAFSNAVLPFTDENNTFSANGTFNRTFTISPTLMSQIIANPSAYSFGVNTAEYPNGAITGTLAPIQTFGGTLSGSSVVGTNGVVGAGAPNVGGTFTAQILPGTNGSILYYTFIPTGLFNSFTNLTLNQGTTGNNGAQFLNLAGAGTLVNGQYSGSVPLTAAQTQQLMSNPGGFYFQAANSEYNNGATRAQFGATQNELWLPVVGNVTGSGNSQWATDVRIFNESYGVPATITVQYFPSSQNNGTAGAMNAANVTTISVPPRGVNVRNAVLSSLFSINTGLGSLRLASDQPIVATARVYNDQRNSGRGTLGQIYAGLTRCEATALGVLPGVAGAAAGNFGFFSQRTNLGFFNPNGTPVTALVNITDALGNISGGTYTLTVQPYSLVQLPMTAPAGSGAMFDVDNDIQAGAVTFQSTAPIFAYASVVDNASGDTSILFAKPDQSIGAQASFAEVANIVLAANQAEVQVNTLGQSRATSALVQSFAQQMVTEHNASIVQAQLLFSSLGVTPVSSTATGTFLTNGAQQTINTLNQTSNGVAFDRAFMQSQVQMHQKVLANLDNLLIPSAQNNTQLLQFLQTQRAAVAAHLVRAQQILATL